MAGLSIEQRKEVLNKMWVFSHGLAMLINNGVIEPMTEQEITSFLMDTGGLIITGEMARSPKENLCGISEHSRDKSKKKHGKKGCKK
jgi:hypothetical protein